MPTIENFAEHPFHFPKPLVNLPPGKDGGGALDVEAAIQQEAVLLPRAGKVDEEGNPVPSRTNVSAETLAVMMKNRVVKSWFKPLNGKIQLRVAERDADEDSAPEGGTALGTTSETSVAKGKPKQ